jgi:hypothetical protein
VGEYQGNADCGNINIAAVYGCNIDIAVDSSLFYWR